MSSIAELTSKKKTDKGRKSLSPSVKENFHLRVKFGSKGDHTGTQNLFQPSKQTGSQSGKCESVANKMLRAEDYQKIRTLHQLYLFVSSALFSPDSSTAFQRCFFA